MPRRNRRQVDAPRTAPPEPSRSEAEQLEEMARSLVRRGLASVLILQRPQRFTAPHREMTSR